MSDTDGRIVSPQDAKFRVLTADGTELPVQGVYFRYGWGKPANPLVPACFEVTLDQGDTLAEISRLRNALGQIAMLHYGPVEGGGFDSGAAHSLDEMMDIAERALWGKTRAEMNEGEVNNDD